MIFISRDIENGIRSEQAGFFFWLGQWRRVVGYDLFYTYSFLDNIFLDEGWQTHSLVVIN